MPAYEEVSSFFVISREENSHDRDWHPYFAHNQNLRQVGGKVVSGAEEEDDDEESGGEEEHPAVRGGRSRCLDSFTFFILLRKLHWKTFPV